MKHIGENYNKRNITGFGLVVALIAILSPAVLAADEIPKGWQKAGSHPQNYEMTIDRSTKRSGKAAARIESNAAITQKGFGTLMSAFKADEYRGKRIRLTAWMKTEDAVAAQVWLRLDSQTRTLGFDNMGNRQVKGTTDWTKYELVLDVPEETALISFGFFVYEKGKAWADDFRIEVVGKDVPSTNLMTAEQAKEEFPPSTSKCEYPMQPVNLDFEN
jgi:AraC family transcriptional regulator